MNNAEAKFILQGYRPNGVDAGDATFGAALEQAGRDPVLGDWFARQQAFDGAVSAKLGEIAPPADLRAAILAGGRVSVVGGRQTHWWKRPVWMSLAAGLAILAAGAVALWPRSAAALDAFVLADAQNSAAHGGHGHETDALQATLNDPSTSITGKLPIDYAALHDRGCRLVQFRGRDVLEVCFNRNGVWFHCYIAEAADFPRLALGTAPTLSEFGEVALASWREGEHILFVVSKTGRKDLEALL